MRSRDIGTRTSLNELSFVESLTVNPHTRQTTLQAEQKQADDLSDMILQFFLLVAFSELSPNWLEVFGFLYPHCTFLAEINHVENRSTYSVIYQISVLVNLNTLVSCHTDIQTC